LPSRPTAETVIRQAPGTAEADASVLIFNGILVLGHPVGAADIGGPLRRAQARTPPRGKVDEVDAMRRMRAGKVDELDAMRDRKVDEVNAMRTKGAAARRRKVTPRSRQSGMRGARCAREPLGRRRRGGCASTVWFVLMNRTNHIISYSTRAQWLRV
jgi:hypothetical protein